MRSNESTVLLALWLCAMGKSKAIAFWQDIIFRDFSDETFFNTQRNAAAASCLPG